MTNQIDPVPFRLRIGAVAAAFIGDTRSESEGLALCGVTVDGHMLCGPDAEAFAYYLHTDPVTDEDYGQGDPEYRAERRAMLSVLRRLAALLPEGTDYRSGRAFGARELAEQTAAPSRAQLHPAVSLVKAYADDEQVTDIQRFGHGNASHADTVEIAAHRTSANYGSARHLLAYDMAVTGYKGTAAGFVRSRLAGAVTENAVLARAERFALAQGETPGAASSFAAWQLRTFGVRIPATEQSERDAFDCWRAGQEPTFNVGERVRVLPHADLFMRGVRYLTLESVGERNVAGTDDAGRRHRVASHGVASL